MNWQHVDERAKACIERRIPLKDVEYERAAALWYIGKQLERIADVMEEAHK